MSIRATPVGATSNASSRESQLFASDGFAPRASTGRTIRPLPIREYYVGAAALLAITPESDIDDVVCADLCRCGIYPRIPAAIETIASRLTGVIVDEARAVLDSRAHASGLTKTGAARLCNCASQRVNIIANSRAREAVVNVTSESEVTPMLRA